MNFSYISLNINISHDFCRVGLARKRLKCFENIKMFSSPGTGWLKNIKSGLVWRRKLGQCAPVWYPKIWSLPLYFYNNIIVSENLFNFVSLTREISQKFSFSIKSLYEYFENIARPLGLLLLDLYIRINRLQLLFSKLKKIICWKLNIEIS